MKFERAYNRLWVAGGPTGHAYVYDTRNGKPRVDLALATPGASLINDVALTKDAAYFMTRSTR